MRRNDSMLNTLIKLTAAFALFTLAATGVQAAQPQEHPRLLMTRAGVESIREELGNIPLFDETLERVRAEVDAEIEHGIEVPVPRDFSGGYTHERHKRNWFVMQKAGALFQILQDEKYARFIRDMLFQYEAMYKDLPLHPQERSYARGKLFWQCLNDANWLLYVNQAYDAIYDWLPEDERHTLEENLFRPFADFISVENPQFFNRVHNHSTWGTAAVGMIGLVMDDDELVQRALYGIPGVEAWEEAKDDDGGFIAVAGQQPGFLANLEEPFSPDGYYTEGPYYQRYAMYPFLVFSQALDNARPELEIFKHKNGALLKGVEALLNLADANGAFFPLNDAQKGMSYYSESVVSAVDIGFYAGGRDPSLLSIAQAQGQVLLDDSGFAVARAIRDGHAKPFARESINLRDGPDGTQGGVAVLRSGQLELVFKYTAQGLSHGHYDKLSFSLYEKGNEVLQDYGMVRFVNIEQKGGGNYLPENATWAKQTIAHNTPTVNQASHFGGVYEVGNQHHSELHFFDASNSKVQVVSALEANAYPGTRMRRTMALVNNPRFTEPMVLDILKVSAEQEQQYDLPFYYLGQLIDTNFEYETPQLLAPLGESHGYQHLFVEGAGAPRGANAKVTWINNRRLHTLTTATVAGDELMFTRIGANDPDFNLRRDPAVVVRRNAGDTVFATAIETHGSYNPVTERSLNASSSIAELNVAFDSADYTAISVTGLDGQASVFIIASEPAESTTHELEISGQVYRWSGPYYFSAAE